MGLADLARDRPSRAGAGALRAALALVRVNGVADQRLADAGRTGLIHNVSYIFVSEIS